MATPKPKTVFLLVDTPDHSRAIQQGQPPTTMACYPCPIDGSDTIDDTIQKNWQRIPMGSTVLVTTDAKCDRFEIKPTLEPVT